MFKNLFKRKKSLPQSNTNYFTQDIDPVKDRLNSLIDNFKYDKKDYKLCLSKDYWSQILMMKDKKGHYYADASIHTKDISFLVVKGFECVFLAIHDIYLVKKEVAEKAEIKAQELHQLLSETEINKSKPLVRNKAPRFMTNKNN